VEGNSSKFNFPRGLGRCHDIFQAVQPVSRHKHEYQARLLMIQPWPSVTDGKADCAGQSPSWEANGLANSWETSRNLCTEISLLCLGDPAKCQYPGQDETNPHNASCFFQIHLIFLCYVHGAYCYAFKLNQQRHAQTVDKNILSYHPYICFGNQITVFRGHQKSQILLTSSHCAVPHSRTFPCQHRRQFTIGYLKSLQIKWRNMHVYYM
jgi:hypothetical protein